MAIEVEKQTQAEYVDQQVERHFNQISPDVRNTFTPTQEEEVRKLIRRMVPTPAKKLLNIRFTFWFLKKIFAVFFIGVSKRKKERKTDLKGLHKFLSIEFKIIFYVLEIVLVLFVVLVILVLLNAIFGINVIKTFI